MHYRRILRYGEPLGNERLPSPTQFQKQPPLDRFWANVARGADSDCWEWSGARIRNGYGRFWTGEREMKAHRYSYELHVGPIPDGLLVCHSCDNPPCVNPAHLWVGTNDDNMADKKAKGRNPTGDANGSRRFIERMPRGERHSAATITNRQASEIIAAYEAGGVTQTQLAARYGASQSTVGNIVNRQGRFAWL